MQIVRVQEKEPFVPVAIEIGEDVDAAFLSELVKNTYGSFGAFARKRGEKENGAGGIDIRYGSRDYDYEYIRPGDEGWLLLGEKIVSFYRENSLWSEYEKVD